MRTLIALAFLVVAVHTLPQPAATRLDGFLRARVEAGDVPAVVAMVVGRDATLYTGAFGKANVAQDRPVQADSIFRIASMTKPITSLAVMMLYDEGRVGLDDPVTKYLPEFSKVRVMTAWHETDATYESRPPSRMITIRDLLTHTSGLAYTFVDARLAKLESARAKDTDLLLLHDPGAKFTYGPSTMVLGRVIEKISGEPLDAFFTTRIFEPLGMPDTFYAVPPEKRDRVVTTHRREGDSLRESPNGTKLAAPAHGDGGLFSTAADYARFMQLILNRGQLGRIRLLKDATVDVMTANQIGTLTVSEQPSTDRSLALPFPIGAGKDRFGFGFQIEAAPAAPDLRSAGSLSWGGIFNTHFWIDPERSIAAVVLMQVLPYYDPRALDVLRGFEREVSHTVLLKKPSASR